MTSLTWHWMHHCGSKQPQMHKTPAAAAAAAAGVLCLHQAAAAAAAARRQVYLQAVQQQLVG
jgi:hypothetical protein